MTVQNWLINLSLGVWTERSGAAQLVHRLRYVLEGPGFGKRKLCPCVQQYIYIYILA